MNEEPSITATSVGELEILTDRIHDRWFSVEDVQHNVTDGTVVILFTDNELLDRRSVSSLRFDETASRIVVRNVDGFRMIDRERVAWYDFNYVHYDGLQGIISFATNIPLTLEMTVSGIDISVFEASDA